MTDPTASRTLVLARHAKAENDAPSDKSRELTHRGHGDAAAMGAWLLAAGLSFDAVLCSTATRTRQTWSNIDAAGVAAGDVLFDDRVYNASVGVLLAVISELPEDVASVLVIGHASTIPEVADLISDPDTSQPAALQALRAAFPSGCIAVLQLHASWSELGADRARLTEVATPRS